MKILYVKLILLKNHPVYFYNNVDPLYFSAPKLEGMLAWNGVIQDRSRLSSTSIIIFFFFFLHFFLFLYFFSLFFFFDYIFNNCSRAQFARVPATNSAISFFIFRAMLKRPDRKLRSLINLPQVNRPKNERTEILRKRKNRKKRKKKMNCYMKYYI